MNTIARCRFATSNSGRMCSASFCVKKAVARHLRADYTRQRQRALQLGGGGGHIRERQRGKRTEAPLVFLANL